MSSNLMLGLIIYWSLWIIVLLFIKNHRNNIKYFLNIKPNIHSEAYIKEEYIIKQIEVRKKWSIFYKHSFKPNFRVDIVFVSQINNQKTIIEKYPIFNIQQYLNDDEFIDYSKELFSSANFGDIVLKYDSVIYKKMLQIFPIGKIINVYIHKNKKDHYINFDFVKEHYIKNWFEWHWVFSVLIFIFLSLVIIFAILLKKSWYY